MNYEVENIELRNAMKLAHEKINRLEKELAAANREVAAYLIVELTNKRIE